MLLYQPPYSNLLHHEEQFTVWFSLINMMFSMIPMFLVTSWPLVKWFYWAIRFTECIMLLRGWNSPFLTQHVLWTSTSLKLTCVAKIFQKMTANFPQSDSWHWYSPDSNLLNFLMTPWPPLKSSPSDENDPVHYPHDKLYMINPIRVA